MTDLKSIRGQYRGFTLVEVLVATVILSVLSLALVSTLRAVTMVWQREQSQIEMRQTGRSIIDFISRDLRAAELPADRSNTNDLQFVVNPDSSTGTAYPTATTYFNPQALFWQISMPKPAVDVAAGTIDTSSIASIIAEIGYFVRWDTTNPGNPRASLCRLCALPYTYTSTGNTVNANYLIRAVAPSTTSSPAAWLTDSVLNTVSPGNIGGAYQGWFADNVIALWARCLDPQGNTIMTTATQTSATSAGQAYDQPYVYDSRQSYSYTPNGAPTSLFKNAYYNPQTSNSQILATLPASVEIAMVIVSSQGAQRIAAVPAYHVTPPTAMTPNPFWSDINAFVAALPAPVRSESSIYSAQVPLEKSR